MFTGIITDVATVKSITGQSDKRLVLHTGYGADTIDIGASIACSGVCLTVVDKGTDKTQDWFAVDVSAETLSCSTLGEWKTGQRVNLERALRVGDELGGHIVTGHVDGLALIQTISPAGDSLKLEFSVARDLARYIAPKGSVTLDGVSLTVNQVVDAAADQTCFTVNIIPHTRQHTAFSEVQPKAMVNLEIDVLARYVARMQTLSL